MVIQCLHKQFQEAIHEDYFMELDDPNVGLTNELPSVIYQHIIDRYAKIDFKMADVNCTTFNEPMDLKTPIVVYNKKQV